MRSLAALALPLALLAGCKRPAPPDAQPAASAAPQASLAPSASSASSASSAPSAAPPAGSAEAAASGEPAPPLPPLSIEAAAVSHRDHARRTLYVWVTPEQAALLRRDRSLTEPLRRSKTPRLGAALAEAKDPTTLQLLQKLKKSDRKLCGLAWVNPWGAMPLDAQKKHLLVRLTLRPEAYLGTFEASQKRPWSFVDGQGNELAAGKVMARPELLGAVYYATAEARGYALVGDEAIASWSLETAEVNAELDRAAAAVESATAQGEADDAWKTRVRGEIWPDKLDAYEATLSAAEAVYHPSGKAALAQALRDARTQGKPLTVKPAAPGKPFADLLEKGVQRQVCTEHGDKTRCNPLPPSSRRAHDGRFCVDDSGHMIDCKKRR